MDHNEREKLIFDLIDHGQWDKAIEHAKVIPDNHDIWQRLPSVNNERNEGMPNSAINKVLDHLGPDVNHSGFLFEMANNLYDTHDASTLRRLAQAANDHGGAHFETDKFVTHPNYEMTEGQKQLGYANAFWNEYERNVSPHHFAIVKSLYSGQPETIKHRGIEGTSASGQSVLPHLHDYAAKVQEKILNDDNLRKRYYNGEPYIKVHRGVGGHYSKAIRDAAKYNSKTGEFDHKTLTIPVTPFSSWTTDKEMAKSFAKGRGSDLDMKGHGLVMSKWMPVKDILHSGYHNVLPGRTGVHPSEQEIIVGHPTGRMKMSTGELHFENRLENTEDPDTKYYGSTFDKGRKREKVSKGLRDKALQLGVATAMMGMPAHMVDHSHEPIITPNQSQSQSMVKPLPGLKYIEMIESSGGKNMTHQTVRNGLNAGTKAIGRYGLMPLQAIETVSKDKGLSTKHPEFLKYNYLTDADKISDQITKDPNLENEIANAHWKRLYDRFDGDENKMAHAWLHGITGTLDSTPESIANHEYVKKYQRYKKMMELEGRKPSSHLHKSESKLPPEIKSITGFQAFDNKTPENQLKAKAINGLIHNMAFHAVPGMGHFTHSSFVLGTNHENSWLIKVEAGNRPGIMSAKAGLQSVKESSFYDVAKEFFGMGELLPEVLLGEVTYEHERKPAAAIKMLPANFKLAAEQEQAQPGSMSGILDKYRKSGLMHKAAMMLYVLGDGDSHGRNVMTDGYFIRLIDHGSGFANADFNPAADKNIFIPYILRVGAVTDKMTPEQKLDAMPRIENAQVKENLSAWILSLNSRNLAQKLNNDDIDPAPSVGRLKKLQSMVAEGMEPDLAINTVWVRG